MIMTEHNPTVHVDVKLAPAGSDASFGYQGADEKSRIHVEPNGKIDLTKKSDLNHGPIDLEFQLGTTSLALDGMDYDLEFLADKSVTIAEEGETDRRAGDEPQFYGYANPGANPHRVRFSNKNNDGKKYKYTLRVKARARESGQERWLEHDPIIQNRGGGGIAQN
jgi:hypothetical protein